MEYYIDPNTVLRFPMHGVPWLIPYKFDVLKGLGRKTAGIVRLNRKAFGPGGFSGIEFVIPNMCLFNKNLSINYRKLRKIKRAGWKIGPFHGCYSIQIPTKEYSVLNLTRDDRFTKDHLLNNLKIVSELGSGKDIITFHPGHIGKGESREKAVQNVIDNMNHVMDYAEENNIILTVENGYDHDKYNLAIGKSHEELRQILDGVGSRNLKVTFDWGHANVYAQEVLKRQDDKRNFRHHTEMIKNLGNRIIHAHIHYNRSHKPEFKNFYPVNYKFDEHLPLTRIPDEDYNNYRRIIRQLVDKTGLKRFRKVTFEMPPRKIMAVATLFDLGASLWEQLESIRIMEGMLKGK